MCHRVSAHYCKREPLAADRNRLGEKRERYRRECDLSIVNDSNTEGEARKLTEEVAAFGTLGVDHGKASESRLMTRSGELERESTALKTRKRQLMVSCSSFGSGALVCSRMLKT